MNILLLIIILFFVAFGLMLQFSRSELFLAGFRLIEKQGGKVADEAKLLRTGAYAFYGYAGVVGIIWFAYAREESYFYMIAFLAFIIVTYLAVLELNKNKK